MQYRIKPGSTFSRIRLGLLILIVSVGMYGQDDSPNIDFNLEPESLRGNFYLIPETGFWFGTYTNIEVAPQIAYHLLHRWSIGAGPHYLFYAVNEYYAPVSFSSHIFGIKAFSRFTIVENAGEILPFYIFDDIFLHVEYEVMSLENRYFNRPTYPQDGRFLDDYFYVGAGVAQKIGPRSSYFFVLLWNLNQSWTSLYNNPTYRVGVSLYLGGRNK